MRYLCFLALILLSGVLVSRGQSEWFKKRSAELDQAELLNPGERIEKVGVLLGLGSGRSLSDEQKTVFNRAQNLLLATPGHAIYFTSRLEKSKQAMLADEISYHEYTKAQENLSVLAFLPSPETVAELGKLLNDPVGRDGKILGGGNVWEGDGWLPVNCLIALSCLERLPIENGPKLVKGDVDVEVFTGVDKWKDWWNEVKAGKKTYRFVGSPIEYGPDGPVPVKDLQRREREAASVGSVASNRQEAHEQISESKSKWPTIFAATFASLMLLIAGWKVFGKPKPTN